MSAFQKAAATFAGFPLGEQQKTVVKRGETERGPISFHGIGFSLRLGEAKAKGLSVKEHVELLRMLGGYEVPLEETFINDPIMLDDLVWHRVYEEWLPVGVFAERWIPPMASARQIGYLKGLEKLASSRIDYLNLTSEQAIHLIAALKAK
jgi:hypothetical protein